MPIQPPQGAFEGLRMKRGEESQGHWGLKRIELEAPWTLQLNANPIP